MVMKKYQFYRTIKFSICLLLVCWTFNLLVCLIFHSHKIQLNEIFTFSSIAYSVLTSLLIKYFEYEKK